MAKEDKGIVEIEKDSGKSEGSKSPSSFSSNYELTPAEKKKTNIIETCVSFGVASVLFITVALIEVFSLGLVWSAYQDRMRILCDSFFVSGVLGVATWVLMLISREGGFDMITYGVKKFFLWTFTSKKHAKESLPTTFYDYVMEKKGKKHHSFFPTLLVFGLFLALSFVFMFLAI